MQVTMFATPTPLATVTDKVAIVPSRWGALRRRRATAIARGRVPHRVEAARTPRSLRPGYGMSMPPTLVGRDVDCGRREIVRGVPAPGLRPHVRGYCGYFEDASEAIQRVQVPSGSVGLIVGLGPPVGVAFPNHGAGARVRVRSFVAGLHDSYAVVESAGWPQGLQIELTPIGAYMLFDLPMHTLANRVVELDQVLGSVADRLAEQLFETESWEARFRLVNIALGRLLAVAREPSPAVAWAWRRLSEADGRLGIGPLAEEVGSSRQYLVRRFREEVGLPPKTLARILRFQRTIRLLERAGQPCLSDVAQDCGYYDQAHFNRDFRQLTGCSPTELLARRLPHGAGVVSR